MGLEGVISKITTRRSCRWRQGLMEALALSCAAAVPGRGPRVPGATDTPAVTELPRESLLSYGASRVTAATNLRGCPTVPLTPIFHEVFPSFQIGY